MRKIALAIFVTLSLGACVTAPSGDAALAPPPTPGRTALSVIGTPFLVAFKISACVLSAAIAAPLAGAAELARTRQAAYLEESLGDGLEQNCGPPYVMTP